MTLEEKKLTQSMQILLSPSTLANTWRASFACAYVWGAQVLARTHLLKQGDSVPTADVAFFLHPLSTLVINAESCTLRLCSCDSDAAWMKENFLE